MGHQKNIIESLTEKKIRLQKSIVQKTNIQSHNQLHSRTEENNLDLSNVNFNELSPSDSIEPNAKNSINQNKLSEDTKLSNDVFPKSYNKLEVNINIQTNNTNAEVNDVKIQKNNANMLTSQLMKVHINDEIQQEKESIIVKGISKENTYSNVLSPKLLDDVKIQKNDANMLTSQLMKVHINDEIQQEKESIIVKDISKENTYSNVLSP